MSEAEVLLSVAEGALCDEDGEEAFRSAEKALGLFSDSGDAARAAEAVRILGGAYVLREQAEEGLRIVEEALGKAREAGDQRQEAVLLLATAEVAADGLGQEKREEALQAANGAIEMFKAMGERKLEAMAQLALATVLMQKAVKSYRYNEADSAIPSASNALEIFKSLQERQGEGKALHSLASASGYLGDFDDAVRYGKEALEIWRELGLRRMEAFEQNCVGAWHISNRNPQDALDSAEAAMTIFAELGEDKGWEGVALGTVVSAFLTLGEKGAAQRLVNDKMGRFQRRNDIKGQQVAWDALVAVNVAKDDHPEALRLANSGLNFVRDLKEPTAADRRWEAGLLHSMANIHLADEQYGKCNQAAQAALSILKELGYQEDMAMILVTQSNSSLAMKENRDALKQATDARNICRNFGNRQGEAIASIALTGAHCSRFDMVKAVNAATDAVQLFNAEKSKKGEADATFLLAQVHTMAEDFSKAIASATKAKTLYKEAGFSKDEANMALLMAQVAFFAGLKEGMPEKGSSGGPAWDKALQLAKDGLTIARKSKDDEFISKALSFLAQVYVMTNNLDEAKTQIDEGIAVCVRSGDEAGEACHRTLLTQMHFMNDRHDAAKDPGNKALALYKKIGDTAGEGLINELLKFIDPGEEEYQGPSEEMLAATVMDVALSLIGSESLAGDTPLMDAGLDSLASVEFQNTLAKEFTGVTLPSTLVFDFPTPKMITEHIYNGLREAAKRKALSGK